MNAHAALRTEVDTIDRISFDMEQARKELTRRLWQWNQSADGWKNEFIAPDGTKYFYDYYEPFDCWYLVKNFWPIGEFTEKPEEMLEHLKDEMEGRV